ncbi:MAG: putative capsular polysaccharide synthesis family protein [Colwellia sp.]|nr:putative capsular polysaccharide synthesis family protein [Colwellia sp.]
MLFIKKLFRRFIYYKKQMALYADDDTLFIYQMGKVGSTTLENSLPDAVHIHAFYSKNHICSVRQKGLAKFGLNYFISRIEQELHNYLLRRAFKSRSRTKIITLVREPQARNLSMFFHDIDAYLFAAHTNCLNTRQKPLLTRYQNADMLLDVFDCEFDHYYALNWFDVEFLPMTGLNIYDYPFDIDEGYSLIAEKGIEVLCLRTDKLKDNVNILSQFIEQDVELHSVNKADEKWYGDIYQNFIRTYTPTVQREQKIKESKFFKHFF